MAVSLYACPLAHLKNHMSRLTKFSVHARAFIYLRFLGLTWCLHIMGHIQITIEMKFGFGGKWWRHNLSERAKSTIIMRNQRRKIIECGIRVALVMFGVTWVKAFWVWYMYDVFKWYWLRSQLRLMANPVHTCSRPHSHIVSVLYRASGRSNVHGAPIRNNHVGKIIMAIIVAVFDTKYTACTKEESDYTVWGKFRHNIWT